VKTPKVPDNEFERIKALRGLNILDTKAEERFDRMTRIAKKLFDVPIVLISLVDSNRQWFKSRQGLDATETARDISFCGHAILTNNVMVIPDALKDERFCDNPLVSGNPNIRFYIGCPLTINQQYNLGTLCLIDQKPRDFSPSELAMMRDLADMVQTELESIHLSTTDELTKLANRRGFLLVGDYVFNLCMRNQTNLSLLFFDLDKFKLINDTHGHAEGDLVLQTFANILLETFRNSDVIARLGGDEFCVLCSGLNETEIPTLLQRLEQALERLDNTHYKIEFSVGHMQCNLEKHRSLSSLLEDADQHMYQHKQRKPDK